MCRCSVAAVVDPHRWSHILSLWKSECNNLYGCHEFVLFSGYIVIVSYEKLVAYLLLTEPVKPVA